MPEILLPAIIVLGDRFEDVEQKQLASIGAVVVDLSSGCYEKDSRAEDILAKIAEAEYDPVEVATPETTAGTALRDPDPIIREMAAGYRVGIGPEQLNSYFRHLNEM